MTQGEIETGSSFLDQDFRGLILDDATLRDKEFESCRFDACKFRKTTLSSCRFIDCAFHDCDLSAASVPNSAFRGVTFNSSKLVGIGWDQAEGNLGFDVRFVECVLNFASFSGMKLSGVELLDCRGNEVNFESAVFKGVIVRETDLAGSDFSRADLRNVDLSGARLVVDLSNCRVGGTKLSLDSACATLAAIGIDVVA